MGVHACSSLSPNKDPEGTGKQRGELGGVSKPQPLLRVTGVSDPTVLPTELPRQACPTLFTLCFFPGRGVLPTSIPNKPEQLPEPRAGLRASGS